MTILEFCAVFCTIVFIIDKIYSWFVIERQHYTKLKYTKEAIERDNKALKDSKTMAESFKKLANP